MLIERVPSGMEAGSLGKGKLSEKKWGRLIIAVWYGVIIGPDYSEAVRPEVRRSLLVEFYEENQRDQMAD